MLLYINFFCKLKKHLPVVKLYNLHVQNIKFICLGVTLPCFTHFNKQNKNSIASLPTELFGRLNNTLKTSFEFVSSIGDDCFREITNLLSADRRVTHPLENVFVFDLFCLFLQLFPDPGRTI